MALDLWGGPSPLLFWLFFESSRVRVAAPCLFLVLSRIFSGLRPTECKFFLVLSRIFSGQCPTMCIYHSQIKPWRASGSEARRATRKLARSCMCSAQASGEL